MWFSIIQGFIMKIQDFLSLWFIKLFRDRSVKSLGRFQIWWMQVQISWQEFRYNKPTEFNCMYYISCSGGCSTITNQVSFLHYYPEIIVALSRIKIIRDFLKLHVKFSKTICSKNTRCSSLRSRLKKIKKKIDFTDVNLKKKSKQLWMWLWLQSRQ